MNELFEYLKEELENKDKELFLVVTSDVEKNQDWLNNHSNTNKSNLHDRDAEIVQLKDISPTNTNYKITSTSKEY